MGTNYIAPMWRMPRNTNKDKLSNYSLYFDGSSHEINCGTGDDVNITGPISISVWFNSDSVGNARGIVCKNNAHTSQNYAQYFFDLLSGEIRWRAGRSTVSYGINAGQWYHAVGTFDGSDIKLYIDGTEVATSVAAATSYQSNQPMYIGRRLNQSYFLGEISQVCIFDYSLNQDQINYLYGLNNPMAISGAEPVAYYPLGDNSNPNANAGYPNISVGADSVFDFDGAIGGALINLGNSSGLNITSSLSVSAWFKTLNNSDTIMIATKDNGSTSRAWQLYMHSSGVIRFGINGVTAIAVSSGVYDDGKWHHVLGVYEPSNYVKLYIDGVADGEDTTSVPASINNLPSQDVIIGGYDGYDGVGGRRWDGELSNIQIWDTDLQLSDAETLYNNGQPIMTGTQPQEANLKAWYKLNQYESHWNIGGNSKWVMEDNSSPYTKSFALDSTNSPADYFNTNAGPRGMTTNVGTYSCWINLNSVAGSQSFMDVNGFASREFLNLKIESNNALQMEMRSWSTRMRWTTASTTPFEAGKWYHVVAVGDGTNIKMYINGDEVSSSLSLGSYRWWSTFSTSLAHNGGNKIYLGAGVYPNRHSPLNGRISNAQIWNTDLSPSQVETLYNGGHPLQGTQPAQTNLLAWYKLNQDSTWTNYNYWNNVLVNKWNSKNYAITTTPPTESLGFSGQQQDGDYEGWEVTNKSISGSLLLSFWYKTTGNNIYTWTFNNDGSGNANAGKLKMQGNSYIYFYSPNASNYFSRNNTNLGDYNWHNLIIYIPNGSPTYDANGINMWLDGVELGKPSIVGSTTWDAFTEIEGMNRNGGLTGTGTQWSNWALFENVTPSDSVIDTIFNRGTPGDISSLNPSIWYKLDSTDTTFGTTGPKSTALSITDSSSNNNNATGPYDYDAAINLRPVIINGDVQNAIAGYYMSGNELTDFSVSARDGESSGMNTTNIVQSNLTRKVPYSSYSTSFLGTANRYEVGTTSLGITSAITVSAWVKIPTTNTGGASPHIQEIICQDTTSSSNRNWALNWRGGPYLVFAFAVWHTDGTVSSISTTGITPNNGLWQHVVGTFDGTTNAGGLRIYVDGQQAQTPVTAVSTGVKSTSAVEPSIGGLSGSNSWELEGHISNCAVWESEISDDDAINLYNNGITQDLNNFRITPDHWWPLDENSTYFNGSVLVARDTISGRDGTGVNLVQSDIHGNAPGSDTSGTGQNVGLDDLKGDMKNSDKNAYSINMADYADGVTNPANSGRSTDTPS